MKLTSDMVVSGIALSTTSEEFFQHIKAGLDQQGKSYNSQTISMENVVRDTNMAIDFFLKQHIIEKAVAETLKTRREVEEMLDKIGRYTLDQ